MRAGALISVFAHAGVVAWVLLGTPKPFDTASGEAVAVDLVTPDEAPPEPEKQAETPPKPEPKPEEPQLLIPPRPTTVSTVTTSTPELQTSPSKAAPAPAKGAAAKAAQKAAGKAAPEPPVQQQPPQQQQQPSQQQQQPSHQQSSPQRMAPASPPPPSPAAPPTPPALSMFDPGSMQTLTEMMPQPPAGSTPVGFDNLADTAADLTRDQVATFKAHLKKCLHLPPGVDAERPLRVVMRIFLQRDGALATDPMLVSAPAASEGPALVKAATSALKACAPYALPAEKYNDWKMLELTLSPRDMAGG